MTSSLLLDIKIYIENHFIMVNSYIKKGLSSPRVYSLSARSPEHRKGQPARQCSSVLLLSSPCPQAVPNTFALIRLLRNKYAPLEAKKQQAWLITEC